MLDSLDDAKTTTTARSSKRKEPTLGSALPISMVAGTGTVERHWRSQTLL